MTSQSFRDSLGSLGWSRREPDIPVNTSRQNGLLSSLQSLNPFGDRGYVRLPTTEGPGAPLPAPSRREEEEGWFALTRWDRLLIFAGCNVGALVCFFVCIFFWPLIATKPSKFVLLWTLGSIFFLCSFAAIMGPLAYVQHLASGPRLPFTGAYFGSMALSLYFAIGLRSQILTLFAAIVQLVCLVWYLISYFPMGSSGLRMVSSFGAQRAATWMTG